MKHTKAFIQGFLKAAQAEGCSLGEAWDIYKHAFNTFAPPMFSNRGPVNSSPPMFGTQNSFGTATGSGSTPTNMVGSLSNSTGSKNNLGFNLDQTGSGGVNNSVTSAPSTSVNNVLNKPVASTTPAL